MSENTKPRRSPIVAVAVLTRDGLIHSLPRPARHYEVIHKLTAMGYPQPTGDEQGFIDADGRYLWRPAAWASAYDNGQFKGEPVHPRLLFSEDLW